MELYKFDNLKEAYEKKNLIKKLGLLTSKIIKMRSGKCLLFIESK